MTKTYRVREAIGEGYWIRWEFWPDSPDVSMAIELWLEHQVVPYTRTTQRGQHLPAARKYRRSQETIRAWVLGIMFQHGIQPFGLETRLAFASSFGLPSRDAKRQDLGNLEKAIEDACQSALFPNDVKVWERLPGGKQALAEGKNAWVHVTVRRSADV